MDVYATETLQLLVETQTLQLLDEKKDGWMQLKTLQHFDEKSMDGCD